MKIVISIVINAFILFSLEYFLSGDVAKGVAKGIIVEGGVSTYIIGGIILGLLNMTVKPVLSIISIPAKLLTFGMIGFVINGIILWLFKNILNNVLILDGIRYEVIGVLNFVISVAIFTILNTLYSLLFFKN